jgi:hypothetical protein
VACKHRIGDVRGVCRSPARSKEMHHRHMHTGCRPLPCHVTTRSRCSKTR